MASHTTDGNPRPTAPPEPPTASAHDGAIVLSLPGGQHRQDFLAQVAAEYHACGSTAKVAKLHDCATNTVLRWLAQAGVTVPGRGHWARKKPRRS